MSEHCGPGLVLPLPCKKPGKLALCSFTGLWECNQHLLIRPISACQPLEKNLSPS